MSELVCKCPVCEGRGHVPNGFYLDMGPSNEFTSQCRSCAGRGVLAYTSSSEDKHQFPSTRKTFVLPPDGHEC